MSAEILALGSAAAASDPITLEEGAHALLMLAAAPGRRIPSTAYARVEVQDAGGAWTTHVELTDNHRTVRLEGPGVYRVSRPAGVEVAVDRADATPVTAPVNTAAPAITGSAVVGSTLSCSLGTWTTPARTSTYAYQWMRGGVAIPAQTGDSYTVAPEDVGASITCEVTATNPVGSTTQASNAVVPAAA